VGSEIAADQVAELRNVWAVYAVKGVKNILCRKWIVNKNHGGIS
jgi:hypothetical protein